MPDAVDLAATGQRKGQVAWWDKAHAPKVTWAERREELTLVVHVPKPKTADITVDAQLVTFSVADDAGRRYNVDLPLKKEVEKDVWSWSKEIGSTSVRVRLKKTKAAKGYWQDEMRKGNDTGNNTCLSIDPRKSKAWLAYDWEVYKEDEEDELEDEDYCEPDDEKLFSLPASGNVTEAELREKRSQDWDEREEELRREAEEMRAASKSRPRAAKDKMLQLTFAQLRTLLGVVGGVACVSTFAVTRWYYSGPAPMCAT